MLTLTINDLPSNIIQYMVENHVDELMTRICMRQVSFFKSFTFKSVSYKDKINVLKRATLAQVEWAFSVTYTYANDKLNRIQSVECMDYITREHDFRPNIETMCRAVHDGNLEMVKYLHGHGCEWRRRLCHIAAENGDLDFLKYLHENGCPWNCYTLACAAEGGHVDCLAYAHEHGCQWHNPEGWYENDEECPWEEQACCVAACYGHLECLIYAHTHGCPWGPQTTACAASGGHLECLKYAHLHGCEWDFTTIVDGEANGKTHCVEYARAHGCPE